MDSDRNFDDLAARFQRKVYGGLKGTIRLEVLKRDLNEFFPIVMEPPENQPLHILDAGCGYGPFSLELAKLGHHVTLCDISEKMLKEVAIQVNEFNLQPVTTVHHCAIQKLPIIEDKIYAQTYDLILCHAVLEWVKHPNDLLSHMMKLLKPGGMLSLTFYNLNGLIYKNLLRTNYKKIQEKSYKGWEGSLTPTYPRRPEQVEKWLNNHSLKIACHSGMRVFYDYILIPEDSKKDPETVIELELELSRQMPFRDLGRYQHFLAEKR